MRVVALMLAGGSQDLAVGSQLPHPLFFPAKKATLQCALLCFGVACCLCQCASTKPRTLGIVAQFGMGPMPFIIFLLSMAGVGLCCCFMNRRRLLEWATSGGQGDYDEIYDT